MKISIKNKIVFSVSGVVLIVGVLATVTIFFVARDQFVSYEKKDLARVAHRAEHEAQRFFLDQKRFTDIVANQPELGRYLNQSTSSPQDPEILKILQRYHFPGKHSAVYLMNSDGKTLVSTAPDFVGNNYGFRPYFQDAIKGSSGIYMGVGQTSGEAGYYFSSPVKAEGEVIGVVVTKLKPGIVKNIVQLQEGMKTREDQELDLMLVDQKGVVIATTDSDKQYKSLGELDLDPQEKKELKDRFPDHEIEALDYGKALRRLKTSASLEVYDKKDGERELLEVRNISKTPYTLVLEIGTEKIFSYIYRISFALAGFVLFAVLTSIFIIYLLVWWFMKPLHKIESAIKDINKGDYGTGIDINTGDEWQYLADSFNKMTKTLSQEKKNVDKKINESTERLRKINKAMMGRELKMKELKEENKKLKQQLKNKKK